MKEPSALVSEARRAAGLTQAQLAQRSGTTQTAIARLERRGSNPTVATLTRVLRAAGRELELGSVPAPPPVDEAQLERNLRLTPAQRIARHEAAYRNMATIMDRGR